MKVVTVAQLIGLTPAQIHRILDRHLPDRWTRYGRPRPHLPPEEEAALRRGHQPPSGPRA